MYRDILLIYIVLSVLKSGENKSNQGKSKNPYLTYGVL